MYTKSLSAVLIESSEVAKNLNLEEEFFDILSLTEGEDFKKSALSRINNTKNSKKRKAEELEQIIDYFENQDLTMVKASFKKAQPIVISTLYPFLSFFICAVVGIKFESIMYLR